LTADLPAAPGLSGLPKPWKWRPHPLRSCPIRATLRSPCAPT